MDISKPKRKPDLVVDDLLFWWKEMLHYDTTFNSYYELRYDQETNAVQWHYNHGAWSDFWQNHDVMLKSYLDYIDSKIEEELFYGHK